MDAILLLIPAKAQRSRSFWGYACSMTQYFCRLLHVNRTCIRKSVAFAEPASESRECDSLRRAAEELMRGANRRHHFARS
jgi:hypothetical protein